MTDKEKIMIDGVDVSGCSYGEIEKDIFECSCEYNVRSASMFCKDNPNCYFKQLARKTQECEKLKEEREEHRSNAESYCKSYQYSCVVNGKITDKALKYKQALDEIGAHYQKVIKNITNYDDSYDASISIEALHNISDIINKAKDGNNE